MKRLALVLLGLALAAALVAGGWLLARAQGQRAQAALRDRVAVLTGDLVTQVHRAEDLGAQLGELSDSAGVWSDSVRVLVAWIRARSTPRAGQVTGQAPGGPVGPVTATDTNGAVPEIPESLGTDLTPALVEACSRLATHCDQLRDSVAVLVDSVQGLGLTVRRYATTIDSALAEPGPAPALAIDAGGFSTGLAVGAGGMAALLLTLALLLGR